MYEQARIKTVAIDTKEMLARANELIAEASLADGQKAISDQALISGSQGRRQILGFVQDTTADVKLLALGIVGEGELDLVVHPSERLAGIGTIAFNELLNKAEPGALKVWVHGTQGAADALLSRANFEKTRTLLRMECDPASISATASNAEAPAGFYFDKFNDQDETELQELLEVNRLAFASHPEQGRLSLPDLKTIMNESWYSSQDLIFLRESATMNLAGFGWVKTTTSQINPTKKDTELYVLAVHPEFGGKGLGGAILNRVFERMLVHDPHLITLYVEGDNEPALKIYKRAGFCVSRVSHQWTQTS